MNDTNRTTKKIITIAQEVGKGSAFRLLQRRGKLSLGDFISVELEIRDYFVNSHLPELRAFDGNTLRALYELAARAGIHAVIEDQKGVNNG